MADTLVVIAGLALAGLGVMIALVGAMIVIYATR